MTIDWPRDKNEQIKNERGFGFEDAVREIELGKIIDRLKHPNGDKYPNQEIFVVKINGQICYVPFVKTEDGIFLKNVIPSRKLAKLYDGGSNEI